ncbi:MAG: hypothetical protein Q9167_005742 [Letrouitia subvulpina]
MGRLRCIGVRPEHLLTCFAAHHHEQSTYGATGEAAIIPFGTQFALQLELTRLLPLQSLISKAAESVIDQVRDLQKSGSDAVTELDLVKIFGHNRINPNLARSFRTVVSKSSSTPLCEGISLDTRLGPTVRRALASKEEPYFRMVIQCSFLTSALQTPQIATALHQSFERIAAEAPRDSPLLEIPSEESLFGVLRSCQEQTCEFKWDHLMLAVARTLGLDDGAIFDELPPSILNGLLYMLPIVSSLPEDRLIIIEGFGAISLIIVWAYHILDISVLVKRSTNEGSRETRFGSDSPNLIIEYTNPPASITLLATSKDNTKEVLFHLEPDHDEKAIDSVFKYPALGYGKKVFKSLTIEQSAIEEEMTLLICAHCIAVSRYLRMLPQDTFEDGQIPCIGEIGDEQYQTKESDLKKSISILYISEQRVLEAAMFIFGDRSLTRSNVDQFLNTYHWPLAPSTPPPSRVEAIFRQNKEASEFNWYTLCQLGRYLSVLILAFAHVHDLEACAHLPLLYKYEVLCDHHLTKQLLTWDGKTALGIHESSWVEAVALLMIGHKEKVETTNNRVSLLSDRG